MQVLKPGRPQKGWAKEFECTGKGNGNGGCGGSLLVEQADVFRTTSSCMGDREHHNTFRCVSCGVLTDIDGHLAFTVRDSTPQDISTAVVHSFEHGLETEAFQPERPCSELASARFRTTQYPENDSAVQRLLKEGWQPFATTPSDDNGEYLLLFRRPAPPSDG